MMDNDSSSVAAKGDSARQAISADGEMVVFMPCLDLCFLF